MYYSKKPLPVRAIQWKGQEDNKKVLPAKIRITCASEWAIETLEGRYVLTPGCWIVGPCPKGEYWPVDNEIFEKTYQPSSEAFKFDRDEADLLVLAVANFIADNYSARFDEYDYAKLSEIITKFSSGVYR